MPPSDFLPSSNRSRVVDLSFLIHASSSTSVPISVSLLVAPGHHRNPRRRVLLSSSLPRHSSPPPFASPTPQFPPPAPSPASDQPAFRLRRRPSRVLGLPHRRHTTTRTTPTSRWSFQHKLGAVLGNSQALVHGRGSRRLQRLDQHQTSPPHN